MRLVVGLVEDVIVDRRSEVADEVVGGLDAAPARDVLFVAIDPADFLLSSPELRMPLVFSSVELLREARER